MCSRARNLTSTSLAATLSTRKQTTNFSSQYLRSVSVTRLQDYNVCFYAFSATILTLATRKCNVYRRYTELIFLKLCLQRKWSPWSLLITPITFSTAFLHLGLRRSSTYPLRTRSAQLCVKLYFKAGLMTVWTLPSSIYSNSWGTHCSRTIDNSWLSLIRSQCAQERNYVPCTLKSHRSGRLSSPPSRVHVLASDELWHEILCYQCDVCLTYRDSHEVSVRPWAKVAAEFCYFSVRILLVVTDYFGNFIEVDSPSQLKPPRSWSEISWLCSTDMKSRILWWPVMDHALRRQNSRNSLVRRTLSV